MLRCDALLKGFSMKKSNISQWKIYAELEEIPSAVKPPQTDSSNLTSALAGAWRSLLTTFCQELLYEQQVDYLERCMTLSQSPHAKSTSLNQFQKLFLAVILN
jgi:hypothetical protein